MPSVYYPDADGDGFGDPEGATQSCTMPRDHVADGTDCDDADPRVHPDGLGCPNPASMIAWWQLDEAGDLAVDSSGNGHDATKAGAVVSGIPGPYGSAVELDGTAWLEMDSAGQQLAPDTVPSPEGTLEAWVRVDGTGPDCVGSGQDCAAMIVYFGETGQGDGFGSGPEGHLQAWTEKTGLGLGGYLVASSNNCFLRIDGVDLGTWYHLAMTWSGDVCRLYLDGALVDESGMDTLLSGWTVGRIGVPTLSQYRSLVGAVDEVMIFSAARDAQIAADCGPPCQ